MLRVVKAATSVKESYRVYYGAPFSRYTKTFRSMDEVARFLRSHIFLNDTRGVIVEKVQTIDADQFIQYMDHWEIKDRELSRELFEDGIISRSAYNASEKATNGEEV